MTATTAPVPRGTRWPPTAKTAQVGGMCFVNNISITRANNKNNYDNKKAIPKITMVSNIEMKQKTYDRTRALSTLLLLRPIYGVHKGYTCCL